MSRESWLKTWTRHEDIVDIWHQNLCTGCGALLGCSYHVPSNNVPPSLPDWPFEEDDCPLCSLRQHNVEKQKLNDSPNLRRRLLLTLEYQIILANSEAIDSPTINHPYWGRILALIAEARGETITETMNRLFKKDSVNGNRKC